MYDVAAIFGVGLNPAERTLLSQATAGAWPAARLLLLESIEPVLALRPRLGGELVVLGSDATVQERDLAAAAMTSDGLPRWSVVFLSEPPAGEALWHVASAIATPADLGRVLRLAVRQHAAHREAARARGDLLTIARRISHEMRSPLGAILSSADVLKEEFAGREAGVEPLVQPIVESTHELLALLEQLTAVVRASTAQAAFARVEMGEVVWSARERLAPRIVATGAQLREPDSWPVVLGVREWLERIWLNLVANALEHAGGQPHIELVWCRDGAEMRFDVRDDGVGPPPNVRAEPFRPFHQLHRSDSGRGLGLPIVQRLVELQGGRCGFEPVQPRGSCFFFTLPEMAGA